MLTPCSPLAFKVGWEAGRNTVPVGPQLRFLSVSALGLLVFGTGRNMKKIHF